MAQRPIYVEIKAAWTDEWTLDDDLEALEAELHLASVGGSRATLRREYGPRKRMQWDAGMRHIAPVDYSGYWVRISYNSSPDPAVLWHRPHKRTCPRSSRR